MTWLWITLAYFPGLGLVVGAAWILPCRLVQSRKVPRS